MLEEKKVTYQPEVDNSLDESLEVVEPNASVSIQNLIDNLEELTTLLQEAANSLFGDKSTNKK